MDTTAKQLFEAVDQEVGKAVDRIAIHPDVTWDGITRTISGMATIREGGKDIIEQFMVDLPIEA